MVQCNGAFVRTIPYRLAFISGPNMVGWLICPASSTMHQSNLIFSSECLEAVSAVHTTIRALSATCCSALIDPIRCVSRRNLRGARDRTG